MSEYLAESINFLVVKDESSTIMPFRSKWRDLLKMKKLEEKKCFSRKSSNR